LKELKELQAKVKKRRKQKLKGSLAAPRTLLVQRASMKGARTDERNEASPRLGVYHLAEPHLKPRVPNDTSKFWPNRQDQIDHQTNSGGKENGTREENYSVESGRYQRK
jgi:hypothetical protein